MLLVYTEKITERLQYICHFILKEQFGVDFTITQKIEDCHSSNRLIINYSNKTFTQPNCKIKPHSLLFEESIKELTIDCFEGNSYLAFFQTRDSDFAFDIFAAAFFLLSRYEEYLPHTKDVYGRYAHENSVAFKHNFLHIPLVNIWLKDFANYLKKMDATIPFHEPNYKTIITYDVDMAWSFQHKGFIRNLGGFFKKPSWERLQVLARIQKDPFDSFEWIHSQPEKTKSEKIFFYLVAIARSKYDKNVSPLTKAMKQLIKKESRLNPIGIHPSWNSYNNEKSLREEKNILEQTLEKQVIHSRQHYIKFDLPNTFQQLIDIGIQNDFSMGYGSINGFRASAASSFFWYDLKNEKTTSLRLYPFCFMDANCHYEQQLNTQQAFEELTHYVNLCKENNGLFIPIFHNNFLGTSQEFIGWRELYLKFLKEIA